MPRAIVTPELAETLRGIRLQNKIQAKSLAAYIGKSPAFISKLESGNIQTIDTKELYSILQFIIIIFLLLCLICTIFFHILNFCLLVMLSI